MDASSGRLAASPADTLFETIRDFHNTPARYQQLQDAITRNEAGRLDEVAAEIEFCRERERDVHVLMDALAAGENSPARDA